MWSRMQFRNNIFTCHGKQKALLGSLDISSYQMFFDFMEAIESDNSCSGLCPDIQMKCFYFSDITNVTTSTTLTCIESIISDIIFSTLGVCIPSAIFILIAFINICASYVVCYSKEDE